MDEAQQRQPAGAIVEADTPPQEDASTADPVDPATAPLPLLTVVADDAEAVVPATPAIPVVRPLERERERPPRHTRRAGLATPLSPWTAAFLGIGVFTVVGLAYSATELFAGADWAAGARIAAYAAFGLAAVGAALATLRFALGRRAASMLVLAVLLVVVLAGTGTAALIFSPQLHRLQARTLEQSGRFDGAIHEYALAGDTPPSAPDTARTYVEWAESLLSQGHYADALARFLLVTTTYQNSGASVTRAADGIFDAYSAWVASGSLEVPYPDAIAYFQDYLNSTACTASCQSGVKDSLARASYQYGLQLIKEARYADALTQLGTVQTHYPHSTYAALGHTAAATAYLGLGHQQLVSACGSAVKTYKTLAKNYADTPEGQQAKKALAAPQNVTGTITGFPRNPPPTAYLSHTADPIAFFFSNDYHAALDGKSGAFTFTSIPQGTYFLDAVRDGSGGTSTKYWFAQDGSLYTVRVGPLCPVALGAFPYAG